MEELAKQGENVERFRARGTRYEVRDSMVPGLRLRVAADGSKSWSLAYRTKEGEASRYRLGDFPGLKLAQARKDAEDLRTSIRKGGDPQGDLRKARAAAKAAKRAVKPDTVEGLALRCVGALNLRPATRKEWTRLATREISKAFPGVLAKDLTRSEVRAWSASLAKRAGYVANRSLSFLARVYAWAASEEIVEASPCIGVKKPFTGEAENDRVLGAEEIRSIMRALDALDLWAEYEREEKEAEGPHAGYIDVTRLLMLTGVRRDAVLGMKREELEGLDSTEPTWTLPGGAAGRSKSGRAHVVPLSLPALEVIRRRLALAKGACLFPVSRLVKGQSDKDRPATWSSRYVRILKETADAIHGEKMARWRVHDFRSTLATHSRQILKARGDVVAALLGHTPPGAKVTRVYNRAELLDEKRAALVAWAAWLDEVKTGAPKADDNGAKVLPMRARA